MRNLSFPRTTESGACFAFRTPALAAMAGIAERLR